MPWYEYYCEACQCHFEVKQGFDAAKVKKCPDCGYEAQREILAVNHIHRWTLSEKSYEKYHPMELVRDV